MREKEKEKKIVSGIKAIKWECNFTLSSTDKNHNYSPSTNPFDTYFLLSHSIAVSFMCLGFCVSSCVQQFTIRI